MPLASSGAALRQRRPRPQRALQRRPERSTQARGPALAGSPEFAFIEAASLPEICRSRVEFISPGTPRKGAEWGVHRQRPARAQCAGPDPRQPAWSDRHLDAEAARVGGRLGEGVQLVSGWALPFSCHLLGDGQFPTLIAHRTRSPCPNRPASQPGTQSSYLGPGHSHDQGTKAFDQCAPAARSAAIAPSLGHRATLGPREARPRLVQWGVVLLVPAGVVQRVALCRRLKRFCGLWTTPGFQGGGEQRRQFRSSGGRVD